jgi:hypothetical protein
MLDGLIPGDSTEIDEATLGMLFPPGEAAGVIDERTRTAAIRFARDHCCRFLFERQSSKSTFLKLPGRSHELIDRLCTTWAGKRPAPKTFKLTSIMRSPKLRRVHQNQRLSRSAKHRSSASENFRRLCAKYYALVGTAIRRIKECGLKLCICSTTLAFESQTISDGKTHRDSGRRELLH